MMRRPFSHRSDLYKNELISSEEIEEVSIEGPDHSDKVCAAGRCRSISLRVYVMCVY